MFALAEIQTVGFEYRLVIDDQQVAVADHYVFQNAITTCGGRAARDESTGDIHYLAGIHTHSVIEADTLEGDDAGSRGWGGPATPTAFEHVALDLLASLGRKQAPLPSLSRDPRLRDHEAGRLGVDMSCSLSRQTVRPLQLLEVCQQLVVLFRR